MNYTTERWADNQTHMRESKQNIGLRMHIALRMLRAWNSGTAGFDAHVVSTVHKWIDDGMKGPIPWPKSPFFEEWAAVLGYSNIEGHVGFRFTAKLARQGKK